MGRNFYYGSDARVVAGSANFAALIGASAESFGLSPEQADRYQLLDARLQETYRAATTPETRTSVAVRAKDEAMRAVQRTAAGYAVQVAAQATVSDAQLIALGLQPRPTGVRRQMSSEPPTVQVVSVVGRVVTIRIHARDTEGRRMADGAMGAIVWSYVGDEPPADARLYRMEGLAPRATYTIVFPNEVPSGATAFVSAGWVSRRGQRGRSCSPVRLTIQGGPVVAGSATSSTAAPVVQTEVSPKLAA